MMKIAQNTVAATEKYLQDNLQDFYNAREIASFTDILFEDLLQISKTDRITDPEHRLSESDLLKIIYACKDLKKYIPVQHITGKAFFMDLELEVDNNVLIPRPETEEMVSNIIRENHPSMVLDFCTGSGCIALALKKAFPSAKVIATDISDAALNVARRNAAKNKLEVEFIEQDVLSSDVSDTQFDLIISNPPYVLESDKQNMSPNVLNHEPHLALFVPDNDALKFYKAIAQKAAQLLKKGGKLYFEIHEEKGKEVLALMEGLGFSDVKVVEDMYGKERVVKGSK
ncbi:MAG: peptide chain release factor N(5)-glutamine methyltransferase [Flavobacteriales bacterium]